MSARRYAADTSVSEGRSREEIERLLERHGGQRFAYYTDPGFVALMFEMRDRRILFRVPMPTEEAFRWTATGRARSADAIRREYEQARRQRWRALLLVIRSKLEAVESGIEEFQEAFLAHIVLPGRNETYGDFAIPQIAESYRTGQMPPMLPGLPEGMPSVIIELPERSTS